MDCPRGGVTLEVLVLSDSIYQDGLDCPRRGEAFLDIIFLYFGTFPELYFI